MNTRAVVVALAVAISLFGTSPADVLWFDAIIWDAGLLAIGIVASARFCDGLLSYARWAVFSTEQLTRSDI